MSPLSESLLAEWLGSISRTRAAVLVVAGWRVKIYQVYGRTRGRRWQLLRIEGYSNTRIFDKVFRKMFYFRSNRTGNLNLNDWKAFCTSCSYRLLWNTAFKSLEPCLEIVRSRSECEFTDFLTNVAKQSIVITRRYQLLSLLTGVNLCKFNQAQLKCSHEKISGRK